MSLDGDFDCAWLGGEGLVAEAGDCGLKVARRDVVA